jgi:hypothetical protein
MPTAVPTHCPPLNLWKIGFQWPIIAAIPRSGQPDRRTARSCRLLAVP